MRLNIAMTEELNDWLNKRSKETGLSKSALCLVALENYRKEQETLSFLPQVISQLEKLKMLDNDLLKKLNE